MAYTVAGAGVMEGAIKAARPLKGILKTRGLPESLPKGTSQPRTVGAYCEFLRRAPLTAMPDLAAVRHTPQAKYLEEISWMAESVEQIKEVCGSS